MKSVDPDQQLRKIYSLVGERAVLLPLALGSKGPKETGWQKRTFEMTQAASYQRKLLAACRRGGNIGVLLGPTSENLTAVDIDSDAEVEPFLALNPKLASSLRTNGANGCQIWVRISGEYPARRIASKLKVPGTKKSVAEWRGGGGSQSVIAGKHPTPGKYYHFGVEALAIETPFDIQWPERWGMIFDGGPHPSGGDDAGDDAKTVELTPERRKRVLHYLDEVDSAVSGQGGSNPTFRFANVLVWGFALTIDQARPFMLMYSAKCRPPWSMAEIEHKLADALTADHGDKSRGYLWGEESASSDDDGEDVGALPSWIPQETLDIAKDIDKPIVFTEGQANGEALLKAGAFPIGLQEMKLKLRAELASFEWDFRQVFLCFDKKARWFEIRAWILLRLAGAEVFQLASWPPVEGNWKEFLETLDHRDIDALKNGLCRIKDRAKREELAGKVARKLKLPKGALIGDFQEPKETAAEKADELEEIEPWPEPVSLHEAFSGAVTLFRTYMFMTEPQIAAAVLWCATTFLYDLLQIHAYLGITAPTKRCGKTTLVNLVALFVRQGLIVAGRVSAAYIYRAIDRLRPTFIVDESQAIFRKSPDVEDIFNAGHVRSTAFVGLVEKVNDEFVERRFNVFCPKVIGLKGKIHDDSLQDRVIEIRLSRIHESDQKEDFWDVFGKIPQAELFIECRRKFVRAVMDCVETFKNHEPELPKFSDGRLKQNWKPLWILAELADEPAGAEKGKGYWCEQLTEAIEECEEEALSEPSFLDFLVKSLKEFCKAYQKRPSVLARKLAQRDLIPTEEILSPTTGLNNDKEAPWFAKGNEGLTPERLARELRGFKVKKIQKTIGEKRVRGYSHKALVSRIFNRYAE